MKTLKVCILDDDSRSFATYSASVKSCFQEFGVATDVDVYEVASSLRKRLIALHYDVMFLDIDMPKEDGIAFAKSLRKEGNTIPIVFVTAREERMFEVFSVQPFGFVRKSKFLVDLRESIRLFIESNYDFGEDMIMFSTQQGGFQVNAKQIVYIENVAHSQVIHLKDGKTSEIRSRMSVLETDLSEKGFIRIHKGYIVNYRYVKRIDASEILLTTGEKLPLSRMLKKQVKSLWLEYGMKNGFTYIG